MKISLYTFTMGRELYLRRLVESILELGGSFPFEHVICFQGVKPSKELITFLEGIPFIRLVHFERNIGIAEGMNHIIPTLKGDVIGKFDDDCVIRSPRFFDHVAAINKLKPEMVFSPYPVGLIGNPGGVLSQDRAVEYSEETDTYYTFRFVNHVGGFARIAPAKVVGDWRFANDLIPGISGNEDGQHSNKCNAAGIRMAYLENALIVEHQESTLGQHERYGKDYFKGRF